MPFVCVNIEEMRFPTHTTPLISEFRVDVDGGEYVTVVGPSGAGKTTLLRIISGLEMRYRGSVHVGGEEVLAPQRSVQFVFQDNRLLPWKTALDNVAFAHENPASNEARMRARGLLDQFDLGHRASAWPKTLSGGEQSRVGLARGLMANPRLLLLDEPFKGLDLRSRIKLTEVLRVVLSDNGITCIMVSHDVDDALAMSDRLVLISSSPMRASHQLHLDPSRPRDRIAVGASEMRRKVIEDLTGDPKSRHSPADKS